MNADLYAVLGIETADRASVDPDDIVRAYRKRARETHPDRHGDPADFRAVQEAYDVLSDPEKRRRYDETGEVDDGKSDVEEAQSLLVSLLAQILVELLKGAKDPSADNLKAIIDGKLMAVIYQVEREMGLVNAAIAKLQRLKGRWKTKRPQNFLDEVVGGQIKDHQGMLENCERCLSLHRLAVEMLGEFSFRCDKERESEYAFSWASVSFGDILSGVRPADEKKVADILAGDKRAKKR